MYKTQMHPSGINPSDLSCFDLCQSCFRCENKGTFAKCQHCSGRHDPELRRDPYDIDDICRCSEGILQYRTQRGIMIQRRFLSNPYGGKVKTDAVSTDEDDWNSYINEKREALGNEDWDPVRFTDGTSTHNWMDAHRKGQG
jgi:hypothetical protein